MPDTRPTKGQPTVTPSPSRRWRPLRALHSGETLRIRKRSPASPGACPASPDSRQRRESCGQSTSRGPVPAQEPHEDLVLVATAPPAVLTAATLPHEPKLAVLGDPR